MRSRVGGFLDELVGRDQRIAIVAHAGVMHAALAHLFGDGYFAWSVRLMPASITRVDVDATGIAALIRHNELVDDKAGA